ncbi:MAG TPA: hypothetical protein VEI98_07070 [Xanthobacteraceae bacterium]|nr:hypothetical protein [Xanthobacteraceae bacterium]
MSIDQIAVLSIITGSFLVFAAVLAWGDRQTRSLTPRIQPKQSQQPTPTVNATPAAREQERSNALGVAD